MDLIKCPLRAIEAVGRDRLFPGCTRGQKPTGRSCRLPWQRISSHPEPAAESHRKYFLLSRRSCYVVKRNLVRELFLKVRECERLTSFASFCSLMFSAMYLTLSIASLTSGDSGNSGISPPFKDSELEHWLPPLTLAMLPPVSAPRLPIPPLPPPESAGSLLDLWYQQQLHLPSQHRDVEPLIGSPLKLLRLESSVLLKRYLRFDMLDTTLEANAWGLCNVAEWTVQDLECMSWTLPAPVTCSGSLSGRVMNITLGSSSKNTARTQQGMVWVFGVR